MSASEQPRAAIPVLAYFSPKTQELRVQNPAANRSLRLAIMLLFLAGLVPVFASIFSHDVFGGVVAAMMVAGWIGLSIAAVYFGAEGFKKSKEPNVKGAAAAAVGFSIGLLAMSVVLFVLIRVVARP
jgi:hypothetical protein